MGAKSKEKASQAEGTRVAKTELSVQWPAGNLVGLERSERGEERREERRLDRDRGVRSCTASWPGDRQSGFYFKGNGKPLQDMKWDSDMIQCTDSITFSSSAFFFLLGCECTTSSCSICFVTRSFFTEHFQVASKLWMCWEESPELWAWRGGSTHQPGQRRLLCLFHHPLVLHCWVIAPHFPVT